MLLPEAPLSDALEDFFFRLDFCLPSMSSIEPHKLCTLIFYSNTFLALIEREPLGVPIISIPLFFTSLLLFSDSFSFKALLLGE